MTTLSQTDWLAARKAVAESVPAVVVSVPAPAPASALTTQVGGDHYKSMPIQPMEFSMANNLDACQHTAIKYVARFRQKGGIQDLEKAKHVIDMLIEFETKKVGGNT